MKQLFTLVTIGAFALALPAGSFAASKKAPPAEPTKPADAGKPAEPKAADPAKHIPINYKVDAIDVAGKNFTHKKKDGTEVKFNISDKTEIMNAGAPAKLADIKVGDTVSGSGIVTKRDAKEKPTEYDVVKITKFGVAPEVKHEPKKKK